MSSMYLVCFLVGLLLTLILSFAGGGHTHHGFHFHFHQAGHHAQGLPGPFNLTSLLGFLTAFGGVGYIATLTSPWQAAVIFLLSLLVGLLVAWLLFRVLITLFQKGEQVMQPILYELQGVLAVVSQSIRPNAVGEIKYVLEGTTRSIGAKSETGDTIERGDKVVILTVKHGIAIVTKLTSLS